MYSNKFILFLIGITLSSFAVGQNVTVKDRSEKVNGDVADGFVAMLEGEKENVSIVWIKFLKKFGRPKAGTGFTSISTPALGGIAYTTGVIYSNISGKGGQTDVWLGIRGREWTVNDIEIVKKDLEKEVRRFGIRYYKDKIQAQIDEAQRAFDATTRQTQRLLNQSKDLGIQLGNNEQEKVKLEERIELNTIEHAVLLQKIENNKLAQDSVVRAGEQIKRVIEMHQERQQKVN